MVGLYIRNPEVERLARQLAAEQGRTITMTILTALRQAQQSAAPHLGRLDNRQVKREKLEALIVEYEKHSITDFRTPDEILGYDENGLPT